MKKIRTWLAAAILTASAGVALAQDQVVYHVNDAKGQALSALRNIRNQLDTEPKSEVIVVTHAQGVDFLMDGAKDVNGASYAATVSALVNRGVKFEICEITLANRNLKKDQFIMEAGFTPSGVVRITKLQKQGYSYLKP